MNAKITSIAIFAEGTIQLIKEGAGIYREVTSYMDAIEELGVLTGAEKLKWVLAKLADVIVNFDAWRERVTKFINTIKSAYNQAKALFS